LLDNSPAAIVALQLPFEDGIPEAGSARAGNSHHRAARGTASLTDKDLAMWYFDSGLAELMGVVYRLCTVIWGN
jgi:hypothetical protein